MIKRLAFILALLSLSWGYGLAQKDCPFGLTDDPAPGQCVRYADRNGDNICDLSQSGGASEGRQANDPQKGDQTPASGVQPELQNVPETVPESQPESMVIEQSVKKPLKSNRPNYHPWLLLVMIAIPAVAGEIWQRQNSRHIAVIQTVWNWMLLVSFLASSLTGIYFILPPESRMTIAFNLSYWHTITGLIFIYIGLYHAIRRAACFVSGSRTCTKRTPCC